VQAAEHGTELAGVAAFNASLLRHGTRTRSSTGHQHSLSQVAQVIVGTWLALKPTTHHLRRYLEQRAPQNAARTHL